MLAEQRYKEISAALHRDGSIRNSELCAILGASRETVRRDLEYMETQGLLRRTHGGAVIAEEPSPAGRAAYIPFAVRQKAESSYKQEIAVEAVRQIRDGQAIALDSGTTSLALAQELTGKFHSLTVVTNSLAVANLLTEDPSITLVMTGGIYRPDEKAFVSDIATMIFSKIYLDTLFLTTCGVSADRGVTYQRMDEILVQNIMMDAAEQTIVISDSSKLGVNSLVRMCGIDRVSAIITDSRATEAQLAPFRAAGVTTIISQERTAAYEQDQY